MSHITKKLALGIVFAVSVLFACVGLLSTQNSHAAAAGSITPTLVYKSPSTITVGYKGTAVDKEGRSFDVNSTADYTDAYPLDNTYQYAGGCNKDDGHINMASFGAAKTTSVTLSIASQYDSSECIKFSYSNLPIGNPDGAAMGYWTSKDTIVVPVAADAASASTSGATELAREGNTQVFSAISPPLKIKLTVNTANTRGDFRITITFFGDDTVIGDLRNAPLLGSPTNPVTPPANLTTGTGSGDSTDQSIQDCGAGSLNWIVCSVIEGAEKAAQKVDGFITNTLDVDVKPIFDTSSSASAKGYYTAWSSFRIIAIAILLIAGLIMVVSQAMGFEILDAYTIRKTLPRLLVAVIGISLSWPLMRFIVLFFDTVGFDIRNLIYAPFSHLGGHINVQVGLASFFAVGAAAVVLGFASLTLILTALMAVFVGFIILVVRQLALVVIIILAPIAIACYVLPNTQKMWKIWSDNFFGLLLMFPIISAFIAAGRVFAAVSIAQGTGNSGGDVAQIIGLVAYFAPYFLLPVAFRLATGAIGTIAGFVNDRNKGAFDRLKKYRSNTAAKNMENIKAGKRWQGNPVGERVSRSLQTASLAGSAGFNPARMRSRVRSARSTRTSAMSAEAEKSAAVRSVLGNDDLLSAALHGRGTEQDARTYLEGLGQRGAALEQNVASIRQARRDMGREAFQDFAAANLAGTGTGFAGGAAEMFDTINRVAGGDRARATRILNSARGQAERAKRVDLYGAGFGTSADQLEALYRGQTNAAAVNEVMTDEALNTKSAYEVGTARNTGLVNMVGSVQRRVARSQAAVTAARATGNAPAIAAAEHEHKRILAASAGLLDSASNSSPENARVVGAILGQATTLTIGGRGGPTLGQTIEAFRTDPEFQQYRREYGSAAAAAAAGPPPGAPGAGGPPPPPPPAPPSDRRLKRHIRHIETTEAGIKLYSFQYIWGGPHYVGVMAQDLLHSHPEAISIGSGGFYRVDYSAIGLEMLELSAWEARRNSAAISTIDFHKH